AVPRKKNDRKKKRGAGGTDKDFDFANFLPPPRRKRGFGFCFGFVRRIGEFRIDGLGNAGGIIRIVDLHNVPPDLPLKGLRNALFKIVPLKPKLRLFVPGALSFLQTIKVEFPSSPHLLLMVTSFSVFHIKAPS